MKPALTLFAALLYLGGCERTPNTAEGGHGRHGRYIGLGTYPAGTMWPQVVRAAGAKDAAVAVPADDEHILVTVDSDTGEVRQCGDLTGICVASNPWTATAAAAPVALAKHAAELQREADEAGAHNR